MKIKHQLNLNVYSAILAIFLFSGCHKLDTVLIEKGVSVQLAELRNNQLSNLKYQLSFQIPDSLNNEITGQEIIEFDFSKDIKEPLILDFRNPKTYVKEVRIKGHNIRFEFNNEHIIIPYSKLENGKNIVEIDFIAGNRALNRNKEYLYSLFVPDRACTAFPCFDQPSLKAKFQTNITTPNEWVAVTNAPCVKQEKTNKNGKIFIFDETEPISTYLFSFVAGKFKSISKTYKDQQITLYHRENDPKKLKDNIEDIFDLQYRSLKWLENYTQINYPFKKFDFIVIPSFQYSGMEHPGAILYRDSKLFLEKNGPIREKLDRANLIAHETAHMWFGDLVTMEWFSEVWLKEVFANFMAGKIVNPQYPQINHDLNFLINHFPASYSVDRTKGANAIEQELDNMKNAGTLYGSIIYHKAPIMMQHLENRIGEKLLQEGVQEYLNQNKYRNATWDDLISILDSKTTIDLQKWSRSWIYEPGMPSYTIKKAFNEKDNLQSIVIEQSDPLQKGRQWSQSIEVLVSEAKTRSRYPLELCDTFNVVVLNKDLPNANFIFPNSRGLGYGFFKLDSLSKKNILHSLPIQSDPVLKCTMYISLWENMLHENIEPAELFNSFFASLKKEQDPQNISLVLSYIESIYWRFLTEKEREVVAPNLERFLWKKIESADIVGEKKSFFNSYYKMVCTPEGVLNLYKIWNKNLIIPDLNLSDKDFTNLSFELAIRNFQNTDSILTAQYHRIKDSERKDRFLFIRPSVSNNDTIRDLFFKNLNNEKNREKEPWVANALKYFHHPLRSKKSVNYIYPSLMLLEELQQTGDIFFPKQWLDATFSGHSSIDAVIEINLFLNEHPEFPENLKAKILQSSDLVFRASIIKKE